jgi:hypothetical protein
MLLNTLGLIRSQGWKIVNEHVLHTASGQLQPQYISTNKSRAESELELEVSKAQLLGMAYANGVNLASLSLRASWPVY